MHRDFAFWVGGTHENAKDIPELERQPGAAGIKVFMGSSTGSLLVPDDEGIVRILARTRRRAAFHSEDEARSKERVAFRVPGDALVASGLARRTHRADRYCAAAAHRPRAARCAACLDAPEEIELLAEHKDIASVEVMLHHFTLSDADSYSLFGTLGGR